MTAAYEPLMLCETDRTAFHAGQLAAHLAYWHGPSNVACVGLVSAEDHAAAGWDVTAWPFAISHGKENAR